jgi:hypothetical protein
MSSDVGAWRYGAAGVTVSPNIVRPVEGPTPGELKAAAEAKKLLDKMVEESNKNIVQGVEEQFAVYEMLLKDQSAAWDKYYKNIDASREQDLANDLQAIAEKEEAWGFVFKYEKEGLDKSLKDKEEVNKIIRESDIAQAEAFSELMKGAWEAVDQYAVAGVKKMEETKAEFASIFDAIAGAFTSSFDGVIRGTQTLSESFQKMGQSILLTVSNLIINQALKQLQEALWKVISPYLQQGFGGLISSVFSSGGSSFDTAAWATSSGAASSSFVGFAEGGVVNRPTFGVIGEGGESEAIVPLSRASEFGFGGGANGFTQNIIVNAGVPETVRREVNAMRPQLQQDAVSAMLEARNRGGIVAKSFGSRNR